MNQDFLLDYPMPAFLTKNQSNELCKSAIMSHLYPWGECWKRISIQFLERDGRKRKKFQNDLMNCGIITPAILQKGEPNLWPLDVLNINEIYTRINAQFVDLVEKWKEQRSIEKNNNSYGSTNNAPYLVCLDWLNISEIKWLIEHCDEFDWHVCNTHPFRFSEYKFYQEPSTLVAAKYSEPSFSWNIPAEMKDKRSATCGLWTNSLRFIDAKQIMRNFLPSSDKLTDYTYAVSSVTLRKEAKTVLFEEKFVATLQQNYHWGLYQLGILNEAESQKVSSDNGGIIFIEKGFPKLQFVANSLDLALIEDKTIENLQILAARLIIINKIKKGIEKLGGWDAFISQYGDKLRKEMLADKEETTWEEHKINMAIN